MIPPATPAASAPPPGIPRRESRWRDAALAAAIYIATVAAYVPALGAGFIWNDRDYVTAPALRSWHGLARIWGEVGATEQYYPLLHSAFWVEHRLWGDAPAGYHLLNVLLHATAAVLLAAVMRRLRLRGGWLAAGVFALHPVCVESVAWVSEQKNTLSTVFVLAAAWTYLGFTATRARRSYAVASAWFVAAILAKSVTATLVPALLVLTWWRHGRIAWRRDVVPLLPWFAAGAVVGVFSGWVERRFIGAEGADFNQTLLERALLCGRAVWFYLGKLAWPSELVFIYPRWQVDATDWRWYSGLAVTLATLAALFQGRSKSRGPLAAVLLYGGLMFPTLGFFNVYAFKFSFVADHWQYLACTAMIAAAAVVLTRAARRWPRPLRLTAAAGLLVVLGGLSFAQSRQYRDSETLYATTLAKNPACWMAHNNLGELLAARGDTAGAFAHYEAALRLRPGYAEAHNNIGVLLAQAPGRGDEAMAHFAAAYRSNARPEVLNNIALAIAALPDHATEAIALFEEALARKPTPGVHYNLAVELAKLPGRRPDALRHYEAALVLDPGFALAHANLADLLAGDPTRLSSAVEHYQRALRLEPDRAATHNNFANLLWRLDRREEAFAHYERALQLQPDFAAAHFNYARKLALLPGRESEAIAHLEAALRAQPDFAAAQSLLAELRASHR